MGAAIERALSRLRSALRLGISTPPIGPIGEGMAMANSKGSSSIRNFIYPGRHLLLPPKSPFRSVSSAYVDYFVPTLLNDSKAVPKPRDVHPHHQKTSSESFLLEEQPSWLNDLLNEPENSVRRGCHRLSSSDSFAYLDVGSFGREDYAAQEEYNPRNLSSVPSWGSQDFDRYKEQSRAPFYAEVHSVKQKNMVEELSSNAVAHFSGLPSSGNDVASQSSGISCAPQDAGQAVKQKQDQGESSRVDLKPFSDNGETSRTSPPASEIDTKRAKQQYAQRSHVRKLQYIAELESNIQAFQAEGSEVTAELEFLNQQNPILSMENKALEQQLESLAQEHMIKYFEHDVLERQIGRLQALYHHQQRQQQQKKQTSSSHRRSTCKDLDSQFAKLSLKHKDQSSSPNKAPLLLDRMG